MGVFEEVPPNSDTHTGKLRHPAGRNLTGDAVKTFVGFYFETIRSL
jgi:hypothetical protein